jgi:dihydrofolate reductase
MIVSLVVAMDEQGVIGIDNRLPWRLSTDMKYFKAITMGKPVLMGRKTHESIGKPLPGRENIVISRNPAYRSEGCIVMPGLEPALLYCEPAAEVMIIGGEGIFSSSLAFASRIYLTEVHACVEGDVYFPEFERSDWCELEREDFSADEKNEYPFSMVVLSREN